MGSTGHLVRAWKGLEDREDLVRVFLVLVKEHFENEAWLSLQWEASFP